MYARRMSPRPERTAPAARCVNWPLVPSDDEIAEVARRLVLNLREAMADRSTREVAAVTGVDRVTLSTILNGQSWPDIATLAKLERGLGSLWPRGAEGA